MKKTNSALTLSALSLIGAMFLLPGAGQASQLSVTAQLMKCKYDTKQKVINCCNSVLKVNTKRPDWMPESSSCAAVAKCTSYGRPNYAIAVVQPRCRIYIPQELEGGGNRRSIPQRRTFN